MKIGIPADIHEHVRELRRAIDVLTGLGADRFVVLGDVFETGKRMEETVALLEHVGAVGVWGNHDLGLCDRPTAAVRARYAAVVGYMETLRPRLELAGCLFSHGLPCWDATDPAVYYLGDPSQTPHLKMTDIDEGFGVSQASGSVKSKAIRDPLRMRPFDPEWTLPSRLEDNPLVWMLNVNGLLMDIRRAPREAQEVAFRKGLIPYIPADRRQEG